MNTYDRGDLVRCSANFKDQAAADLDPTTVRFKFRDPSGTTTTYVYLTDAQLVKDNVGDYHVDVDADEDGEWRYRFEATGNGQSAAESAFFVKSEL